MPELEKLLGVRVVSMSWLAIDEVPVGHRPDGTLRARPVTADFWVLAGYVPRVLADFYAQLLSDANILSFLVDLRSPTRNVEVQPTALEWKSYLVQNDFEPAVHPEGLLHHHLYTHLLQPDAPVHER